MTDLKQRRLNMGLTQRRVARRIGCAPSYISMAERGLAKTDTELFAQLEMALGLRKRIPVKRTGEQKALYRLWRERYAPETERGYVFPRSFSHARIKMNATEENEK